MNHNARDLGWEDQDAIKQSYGGHSGLVYEGGRETFFLSKLEVMHRKNVQCTYSNVSPYFAILNTQH